MTGAPIPVGRPCWFSASTDHLTCPAGHRIRDPLVWDHGCLRCHHVQRDTNGSECGRLVYLVGGGLVTPHGQSLVLLAEVTAAEMRAMMVARMDRDDALRYLGLLVGHAQRAA